MEEVEEVKEAKLVKKNQFVLHYFLSMTTDTLENANKTTQLE